MKSIRLFMRLAFCLCLGTLLLIAWSGFARSPVHASSTILSCLAGTLSNTYTPGITNTPQPVYISVQEDLDDCTATGSTLTAGETSYAFTVTTSCRITVNSPSFTVTYDWNNGTSSLVQSLTVVSTRLADGSDQVTSTGRVIGGFGEGSLVTHITILPQLNLLQCGTPQGVTQQTGPLVFAFL